ncbi:MAG: hypothetical protein HQK60_07730 [Deltaproteobacteria bacterium]|nr:hypothetical protein [Deltaproteobacteria bacterium]
MDEATLKKTPPVLLRLAHAEHFLNEYLRHSGPPIDSYFLMIGYFDAFLFALASVWDMANKEEKDRLKAYRGFRFFKVLRNITVHHSILAAMIDENKFQRPFSRETTIVGGGPQSFSSRLFFRLDVLREILSAVEREHKKEKCNLDVAREYIAEIESRGLAHVYLEDIMSEALKEAKLAVERV